MKYILCYLLFLFLIFSAGFAQTKKYLYYFDKDLNATSDTNSVFFGIGLNDGNLLELKCINNITRKLIFINHYTDSSLGIMQGLFQSYYNNGYQEMEGIYLNNKEEGLWEKWDTAGNIIDSSIYEKGRKIIWALYKYDTNAILRSFVFYDYKNPALDKSINYDDRGNIVDSNIFEISGDKIFTKTEIDASFPGGESAWTRYITQQITSSIDYLSNGNSSGTCKVRFIVDKFGNVTNAEAITMQGTRLAKIALNAIIKGPKWIPAMQNGKAVNAYRVQPITFTMIK